MKILLKISLMLLMQEAEKDLKEKLPEPRKGLKSGSIKNSFCLPFGELINDDHTFISKDKILEKFKSFKFNLR